MSGQNLGWVNRSFYKDLVQGMYSLLYSMSECKQLQGSEFLFLTTIEAMQMMSFALPTPALFGFQYSAPVASLSNHLANFNFGEPIVAAVGTIPSIMIVFVLCAFVGFNLINLASAWERKEKHEIEKMQLSMQFIRLMIIFSVSIFHVPFLTALSRVFTCSGIASSTECTVLYPIVLVAVVGLVSFGVLVTVSIVDPRPKSTNPAARSHSRINIYHFLVKSVFAVMYPSFLNVSPERAKLMEYLWVCVVMCLSVPLAFFYTWYHPYFNRWSTLWVSLLYNLQGWFSVATLIHVIEAESTVGTPSNPETTSVLVFGGSGLAIIFSWLMVNLRWYRLSTKPITSCRNVFEFELRVRAELQTTNPYAGDISVRLLRVHNWFLEMSKQFPSSGILHLFHGFVIFEYHPQRLALVRRSLFMTHHVGTTIDMKFMVYKLNEVLRDKGGSSSVMKIVQFDLVSQEAMEYDRQCTFDLIEFWREIAKPKPSMSKVRDLTTEVATNSALCKQKYAELIQLDPRSAMALNRYSSFLMDIVNDTENSSRLSQRATNLEINSRNIESDLKSVSFDYVGVLIVRGGFDQATALSSKLNFAGEILKANAEAGNLLNELSSNLLGKRLQGFFAMPFATHFEEAMAAFICDGKDQPFQVEHQTFLRDREGSFTPIQVHLEPHLSSSHEFVVFVMFSNISKSMETDNNFVVFEEDGTILGLSKEFGGTFLDLYDRVKCPYTGHLANISSLVKNLRGLKQEIQDSRDGQVWAKFDKSRQEIQLDHECGNVDAIRILVRLREICALGKTSFQLLVTIESSDMLDDTIRESTMEGDEQEDGLELPSISHRNFDLGQSVRNLEGDSLRSLNAPPNKPGKAMSNAGSARSDAKLRRKAMEIRRLLLEDTKVQMDSVLQKLQTIYFRAMVLLLLVCIGQFIFCNGLLSDFKNNLDLVSELGLRRKLSIRLAYSAHTLILINEGFLPLSEEEPARALLRSSATSLMELDKVLFRIRAQVSETLDELYDSPMVEFSYLRKGAMETEYLSLYDGVLRVSGFAYQAANKSLADFRYDDPLVFSLLANVGGENLTVQHGLEQSTDMFTDYVTNGLDEMLVIFEIISAISCICTTVALMFAIYPLIGNGGKIENTKREVFGIFQAIPSRMSIEVGDRFVHRLMTVHGEKFETGVFDDDFQKEDQTAGATNTDRKTGKPLKRKVSKARLRHNQTRQRKSTMTVQKFLIFSKMTSLLILSFVYFISNIILIAKTNQAVRGAPRILNYAGLRRKQSLFMAHELRMFFSGAFMQNELGLKDLLDFSIPSTPQILRHRADRLIKTHEYIMHGSEADYISGTLHEDNFEIGSATERLLQVYTTDGCLEWPETAIHTVGECHTFLNGIMGTGLHNAITQFASMVYDLSMNDTSSHIAEFGSTLEKIEIFNHGKVDNTLRFEREFLQTQLNSVIGLHILETLGKVETERKIMLSLTVTFVLVAVFCYVFFVRRVFQALDKDIKRTRSLLVVIPEDVFQGLGDMQQFLLEQFGSSNQSQSSYGRSQSSRRALVTPI